MLINPQRNIWIGKIRDVKVCKINLKANEEALCVSAVITVTAVQHVANMKIYWRAWGCMWSYNREAMNKNDRDKEKCKRS